MVFFRRRQRFGNFRPRRLRANRSVGNGRFGGRNRNRTRRRTVVTVSNKRGRPAQRNVEPLNWGAGGISTVFRQYFNVLVSGVTSTQYNSGSLQYPGANINIEFSDLLKLYPHLALHYREIRCRHIKSTFFGSCGLDNKSFTGTALVPKSYFGFTGITPTQDTIANWLSEGVIVQKRSHLVSVSTWAPSSPEDWDYVPYDATVDDKGVIAIKVPDAQNVIAVWIIAGAVIYKDFPVYSKEGSGSATTYTMYLGSLVIDFTLELRGRQSGTVAVQASLKIDLTAGRVTKSWSEPVEMSNHIDPISEDNN